MEWIHTNIELIHSKLKDLDWLRHPLVRTVTFYSIDILTELEFFMESKIKSGTIKMCFFSIKNVLLYYDSNEPPFYFDSFNVYLGNFGEMISLGTEINMILVWKSGYCMFCVGWKISIRNCCHVRLEPLILYRRETFLYKQQGNKELCWNFKTQLI